MSKQQEKQQVFPTLHLSERGKEVHARKIQARADRKRENEAIAKRMEAQRQRKANRLRPNAPDGSPAKREFVQHERIQERSQKEFAKDIVEASGEQLSPGKLERLVHKFQRTK